MQSRLHKTRLTPIALAVVSAMTTLPVVAQSTEPNAQITVTGTNIKRTETETASPIQTITAKEIEQSGAKTVLELLKEVTSAGVGGYFDTADQNGFSRGVATASLRSFGSTTTLILLNGRRLAPSAFVNPNTGQSTLYDLNSIPISALDRVEVFKDGASAVYGSDAIAGVINFITRSDFNGKTVSISAGANDANDFGSQNVNAAFGFGDINKDKFNLLVALDVTKRNRTMAAQITDAEINQYAAINFRLNPYNSIYSSSPFFSREVAPGAFSLTPTNFVTPLNCPTDRRVTLGAANNVVSGSLFGRTICNYPTYTRSEAQNPGQDNSLLMVGTWNLGNALTAFGEFAVTQSNREYLWAPRSIDGRSPVTNFTVSGPAASFQAVLPIGHPDNPFPTSRAAALYRFEDLKSEIHLTNTSSRLLGGVRGTAGKWDYESAVLWNRSQRDETVYGELYLPTLRKLVTENRTLASLSADPNLSVPVKTLGTSEILQFDAKASTSFGKLPGGPMGFAAGVEVRDEKLTLLPDPNLSTGQMYGRANQVIDAERQVVSAFAELRAPLSKTLEAEVAGRFDKYPGIATNFVPKFGAKWIAEPNLVAFRGTYSKGFRAPAVSQIAPGGAQFFTTVSDPVRCPDGVNPAPGGADTTDCLKSVSGTGGANPDLKPETSKNISLGMIITPNKDTDILIDLFRVTQFGEVDLGSSDYILRNPSRFPADYISRASTNLLIDANGNPIPGTGPLLAVKLPWTNIGSTQVQGLDFELRNRYRVSPSSRLTTTLRFTQLLKYLRSEVEGYPANDSVGTYAGFNDWSISTGSMPKFRSTLSVAYDTKDHTFVVGARHVSSVSLIRRYDGDLVYPVPYCQYGVAPPAGTPFVYSRSSNGTAGNAAYSALYPDCKIQSWTTLSFGYTYKGLKNTVMSVNVQNILDKKAPYSPTTTSGDLAHNNSLHNATGRYIRAAVRYTF